MPKHYPVRLEFGKGNVSVMACHDEESGIEHVMAFAVHKKSCPIGEEDLTNVGKMIAEVNPAVVFEFSKPASVQVVIDKLIIIRDSLAAYEKQQIHSFADLAHALIISGKFPEPESKAPDLVDADCYCLEKVGDNSSCPKHGHGGIAS